MAAEVLRVLVVAVLVELGLRVHRLPGVARWCGVHLDLVSAPAADSPALRLPPGTALRLRAVDHVMRCWPFGDTCLRRCLVLGHRLRRLNPRLRIGVALPSDGSFQAHAWLEIGGHPLDGNVREFAAFGDAA